jgi:hypothetical protein
VRQDQRITQLWRFTIKREKKPKNEIYQRLSVFHSKMKLTPEKSVSLLVVFENLPTNPHTSILNLTTTKFIFKIPLFEFLIDLYKKNIKKRLQQGNIQVFLHLNCSRRVIETASTPETATYVAPYCRKMMIWKRERERERERKREREMYAPIEHEMPSKQLVPAKTIYNKINLHLRHS